MPQPAQAQKNASMGVIVSPVRIERPLLTPCSDIILLLKSTMWARIIGSRYPLRFLAVWCLVFGWTTTKLICMWFTTVWLYMCGCVCVCENNGIFPGGGGKIGDPTTDWFASCFTAPPPNFDSWNLLGSYQNN